MPKLGVYRKANGPVHRTSALMRCSRESIANEALFGSQVIIRYSPGVTESLGRNGRLSGYE